MGNFHCSSDESQDIYLWSIITRKLKYKDTPLDKKIHNEYLSIIGMDKYKFEISEDVFFLKILVG